MKIATVVARILPGLVFVTFGLNIFLHFLPMPLPEGAAGDFLKALFVSHYLWVVGALQLAGGALLLIGRFVPLGLILLGPVILNILCFSHFSSPVRSAARDCRFGAGTAFALELPWELCRTIPKLRFKGLA
jgi:putative oxidoreductase